MKDFLVIIGGGFSGCMLAAHILRRAPHGTRISLIERSNTLAAGPAYSTTFNGHLLNVPAGRMSALPTEPDHFVNWLRSQGHETNHDEFMPRGLYRDYVESILRESQRDAQGVTLRRVYGEAVDLSRAADGEGWTVQMSCGGTITAQHVVLATGNESPPDVPGLDRRFLVDARYIPNSWSRDALSRVGKQDRVLLVGTGLTMLDAVMTLKASGHVGPIQAVSRHGLVPATHLEKLLGRTPYQLSSRFSPPPRNVRGLLRAIRAEIKEAVQLGADWRDIIDALRPITTQMWQSLSTKEQKRFLRHLRSFWDIHRHRAPSATATVLHQLMQDGQLTITAGRITEISLLEQDVQATLRHRKTGLVETIEADVLVNCMGPDRDPRRSRQALLQKLNTKGMIQVDELCLGLACDVDGRVIDSCDCITDGLYAIGSLRTGQLWESTAVPELRKQAEALANEMLNQHEFAATRQ